MNSRFEDIISAMLKGEAVDFTPHSRMEEYLMHCIEKSGTDGLPAPTSRSEALLYQLAEKMGNADGDVDILETENKFAKLVDRSITEVTAEDLQEVTEIGSNAFRECKSLTKVTVPKGVTKIGNYAFDQCSYLTDITLPDGLTAIGNYSFQYVGGDTYSGDGGTVRINIPEGVTTIGDYAFAYMLLDYLVLPESLTYLGKGALSSIGFVHSITIPSKIKSISSYLLSGQGYLSSVKFLGDIKTIGSYAFSSYGGYDLTLDFSHCSSVPTLSNINAFESVYVTVQIIIPDDLYDAWVKKNKLGEPYQCYICKSK